MKTFENQRDGEREREREKESMSIPKVESGLMET
jgi:hypothetical protein